MLPAAWQRQSFFTTSLSRRDGGPSPPPVGNGDGAGYLKALFERVDVYVLTDKLEVHRNAMRRF